MNPASHPFVDTLMRLRQHEQILLYTRLMDISAEEMHTASDFLRSEYTRECYEYPPAFPPFNPDAALWAAKIIYHASQLILYRENKSNELETLLPPYQGAINASAILSADLCLRFLPQVLLQVKHIDSSDWLSTVLEHFLQQWHYSGIGSIDVKEMPDMEIIFDNNCLTQLYINRVIEKKSMQALSWLPIKEKVMAALGDYKHVYWKELV